MRKSDHWDWLTLEAIDDLTPTIRELTLRTPWSAPSAPGEHIDVEVLIGETTDVRSYSVVGMDGGLCRIAVKAVERSRGARATCGR